MISALAVSFGRSLLSERGRAKRPHSGLPYASLTAIGGLLELVMAAGFGISGFWAYREFYRTAAGGGDVAANFVWGGTLWIGYLFFSARGLLSVAMMVEGAIRLVSGAIGQPCGLLVVVLGERIHELLGGGQAPALDDLIMPWADGFEIAASHAKPWNEATTIELDGKSFRVERHDVRVGEPRPHTYRLAPTKRATATVLRYR